jgi:hypothetical protein
LIIGRNIIDLKLLIVRDIIDNTVDSPNPQWQVYNTSYARILLILDRDIIDHRQEYY